MVVRYIVMEGLNLLGSMARVRLATAIRHVLRSNHYNVIIFERDQKGNILALFS